MKELMNRVGTEIVAYERTNWVGNQKKKFWFQPYRASKITLVLLAWKGTLAPREDPEDQVGHPEGEGDDGVAEEDGQQKYQH